MIEYYILIVIGAIGSIVCSFLLGRKTVKPKQQFSMREQSQEDTSLLPPPPSQQYKKPKGKIPKNVAEFEEQFEEEEEI